MKKLVFLTISMLLAPQAFAAKKIITFDPSVTLLEDKIAAVENAGGRFDRDLWIINAVSAYFPEETRNSSIYRSRGVSVVEDDFEQSWLADYPALPSKEEFLEKIKDSPADIPLPVKETPKGNIPWGVERVNAPAFWPVSQGEGVRVAVFDSGVDYKHNDLKSNYKDGYNAANPSAKPMDDLGHGTHVAGTIAAAANAFGVTGVAPKVDLYAVKVLNADTSSDFTILIDGIQWCVRKKIDVINISLAGKAPLASFRTALKKAKSAGITIVAGAGNNKTGVYYPAKYPETIAVSALTKEDTMSGFSNYGEEIDFIAPGEEILSTERGNKYGRRQGTSMATPHVTGLAALAVAAGNDTPDKVKQALIDAAQDLGLDRARQGYGLINAAKIR